MCPAPYFTGARAAASTAAGLCGYYILRESLYTEWF